MRFPFTERVRFARLNVCENSVALNTRNETRKVLKFSFGFHLRLHSQLQTEIFIGRNEIPNDLKALSSFMTFSLCVTMQLACNSVSYTVTIPTDIIEDLTQCHSPKFKLPRTYLTAYVTVYLSPFLHETSNLSWWLNKCFDIS